MCIRDRACAGLMVASVVTGCGSKKDCLLYTSQQRIIITPGLIDLGYAQDKENELLGAYMAACVDDVILVGPTQTEKIKKGLIAKDVYKRQQLHQHEYGMGSHANTTTSSTI